MGEPQKEYIEAEIKSGHLKNQGIEALVEPLRFTHMGNAYPHYD